MRPTSIRARITATAVLAVGFVLLVVALALVVAQRTQLTAALDGTLRQRADDIAALLASAAELPEEFGTSREEGFAQLVGSDGAVLASSPNLSGEGALSVGYDLGEAELLHTVSGLPIDDDAFRVLSRTVVTSAGSAVLHIGTTADIVGESTEALTTSLAVSIPVVVAVLGALVWWLVGRTLRPVEDIRAEVAAIGGGALDRRVTEPATGDEIASLAATMNLMLERIEGAVSQQQRFVADASHELRSPLTRMRSEIEVDLMAGAGEATPRLESIRDEVVELQQLVDDLLHLARSDAGKAGGRSDPVDLDDIVLDVGRRLQAHGELIVEMGGVSGAQVTGDEGELRRAVHNLAENARRHAAGLVALSLHEEDGMAVLSVADDGPGVPPEHVDRIFERFGRVDDSRNRGSGGSGLGLAIARDIARRHGGDVVLDESRGVGARFVLRIPLS